MLKKKQFYNIKKTINLIIKADDTEIRKEAILGLVKLPKYKQSKNIKV